MRRAFRHDDGSDPDSAYGAAVDLVDDLEAATVELNAEIGRKRAWNLRDQHPLHEGRLAGALEGMTVSEWCRELNRRLLHKLEMEGSARTITTGNAYRVHEDGTPKIADDLELIVKSETDAEHYGDRPFPAGVMHPDTEAFIAGSDG